MSGSKFTHVSQGAHLPAGSEAGDFSMHSHGGALKRLTGGLPELLRRGVTVTAGTVALLSGLGPAVGGSRLIWDLIRGFAFSAFWPSSQTHEATTVTISWKSATVRGMMTIRG